MLAWLLRLMWMTDGASLQGSPSTCMGMDLKVVRVTSLHWWSRSPWPPTCSVAWTQTTTGQQQSCRGVGLLQSSTTKLGFDPIPNNTGPISPMLIPIKGRRLFQGQHQLLKIRGEWKYYTPGTNINLCFIGWSTAESSPETSWWSRWPRCSRRHDAEVQSPDAHWGDPRAWCRHSTCSKQMLLSLK